MSEEFARLSGHLEANEVDLDREPLTLADLGFDAETERFTGADADRANRFCRREYREPFVLPDKI
jgi:hypothetical protein